eukprot:GILI01008168.1.p1 GENE.GILI01008168.1~~GILI01008168.1.p1  ORF type:complete len:705 (-),score=265.92 GILI01008168.1:157-2271(-)
MRKITGQSVETALKGLFREGIASAFPTAPIPEILITQGKASGKGDRAADYQCNNAMGLAKALSLLTPPIKLAPKDIGDAIAKGIPANDLIEKIEPTPQGFINVYIATSWAAEAIARASASGIQAPELEKQRVLVDFSSPNIAKEMHVGHLRSTIIGDSISRLFEFCGHEVHRINHVGDWGTQFGMLIMYLRESFPDFLSNPPAISDLVEFYKAAKKRFDEDQAFKDAARLEVVRLQALEEDNIKAWTRLCDISRAEFEQIYSRLNIRLEERGESFYNPFIPGTLELLEKAGLTQMSDGAEIIVSKEEKAVAALDAKDFVKLLSNHFVQTKRGSEVPEFNPNLIAALKKASILTGDEGAEVLKLGKAESKPLAKFDVQKDIDKLAKVMEPLYVKVKEVEPLLLEVFEAAGILSADKKTIKVPRFGFPLIVRKSDGGYTYDTTDMAAMWHRFIKDDFARVVYVTDVGQYEHFRMCAQSATEMGWIGNGKTWDHAGFGLVSGEDGKKLKSRSGETVKLRELLDEAVDRCAATLKEREQGDQKQGHTEEEIAVLSKKIGYGAVKYFDLKQSRTTDYGFSYDKMLDTNGNTAVYMLYSYARIRSIQRKAAVPAEELATATVSLETEKEKALALCALRFQSVIIKTAEDLFLNHITDFVYELTGKLSEFYGECRVIGAPQQNSRLLLLQVVAETMKTCLSLLGIEVADRL